MRSADMEKRGLREHVRWGYALVFGRGFCHGFTRISTAVEQLEVDPVSARQERELVLRECRAARGCAAYRALLDRLRHKARDGRCHRAGRIVSTDEQHARGTHGFHCYTQAGDR